MAVYPIVEQYRGELRSMSYQRLDDLQALELRDRLAQAHHNNAIEGVCPTPEIESLFAMFVEERTPSAISAPFVQRYVVTRLVPSTAAVAV